MLRYRLVSWKSTTKEEREWEREKFRKCGWTLNEEGMPIYIWTFILCACMWFRGMQFYVYFFIIENYVSHHGDYSFIVIFAFHFFSPNYFQQYKITNIKKTIHIFSFSFLFFIFIFFTVIYVTGKFYFCCIPTANLKNYCLS